MSRVSYENKHSMRDPRRLIHDGIERKINVIVFDGKRIQFYIQVTQKAHFPGVVWFCFLLTIDSRFQSWFSFLQCLSLNTLWIHCFIHVKRSQMTSSSSLAKRISYVFFTNSNFVRKKIAGNKCRSIIASNQTWFWVSAENETCVRCAFSIYISLYPFLRSLNKSTLINNNGKEFIECIKKATSNLWFVTCQKRN